MILRRSKRIKANEIIEDCVIHFVEVDSTAILNKPSAVKHNDVVAFCYCSLQKQLQVYSVISEILFGRVLGNLAFGVNGVRNSGTK